VKPGINPEALQGKLREIDLDFQQTDWPEPIEVVRFRRSDGSEGLLATSPAELELQPERIDDWARPSRRAPTPFVEANESDLMAWRLEAEERTAQMDRKRHRAQRRWFIGLVLVTGLLFVALVAHAGVPRLLWVRLNPKADGYDAVERFGPDEYGVVCYSRPGRSATTFNCVKVTAP
jgi:hypothetical protein